MTRFGTTVHVLGSTCVGLIVAGCATTPPPVPPVAPSLGLLEFSWPAASKTNTYRYSAAEGAASTISKSNVSISFTVFDPDVPRDSAPLPSVPVEAPTGEVIHLPAVGYSLRLDVDNGTDHILRFAGSVLAVEDQNENDLPLFSGGWLDWRPQLEERIRVFYAGYRKAVTDWHDTQFAARRTRSQSYEAAYARWENEYRRHEQSRIMILKSQGEASQAKFDSTPTPTRIEQVLMMPLESRTAQLQATINRLEASALSKARELSAPRTVTTEEWPRLQILPGRTFSGYLLLREGLVLESPQEVRIAVFDLVTRVDPAANPTERATFRFRLVRAP